MNNHTHKYKRIENKKTGTTIYRCDLINCTHYVTESLAWHRLTICFKCNQEFVLTKRKITQMKPKCLNCSGRKKENTEVDKLMELIPE